MAGWWFRFRVHESFGAAGKWYNQGTFRAAGNLEPEGIAIEFFGLLNIVHRKTTEGHICVEHRELLDFYFLIFDADWAFGVFDKSGHHRLGASPANSKL